LADQTLKRLPPGVGWTEAILLGDNLSTGYFAAELADVDPQGTYVVIGCGTVGLLSVMSLRDLGAGSVVALDPVEHRRRQAELRGAVALPPEDAARKQVAQLTDGRGADGVLELVGLPAAQRLAYDVVRPGGTLAVIGCHSTPNFAFSPAEAYDKNLVYKTGRCPARHYMDRLMARVAAGAFDLQPLVTHYFSLDESSRAYELFAHRGDGCIKAVFAF
jgi:threonine dehydrogenase-like Zn-dependent dehydrogenase